MTIRWFEDSGSRSASVKRIGKRDTSTVDVRFKCLGTFSDLDVHNQANIFFSSNQYYTINGVSYLVDSYEVQHLGGDAWDVTAHYESLGEDDPQRPDPVKRTRQFDTAGGTAHVSVGFGERSYGDNPPDMKKAIGVDGETVHGVDIVVPALQWTESYDVANAYVNASYIRNVSGLTGCVNAGSFRGFEAEEVLFLGCSGSQQWDSERGDGPWTLTYKFVASKNETDLTIGEIDGVVKKGHDYLWVTYDTVVESDRAIQRPKHVYCTQVYRKKDFSILGIGS